MGHVPMVTTEPCLCVLMTRRPGRPPLSSSQHRDRMGVLVSWAPRHMVIQLRSEHLFCVFIVNKKMIGEQPYSNGEPTRHTVLWEGIRTTHKLPVLQSTP